MGRKSSLSPEQWLEIERRHLVDGESINSLADEFGINESSIRRKIKPNKAEGANGSNPLVLLASKKIEAEKKLQGIAEEISVLPMAKQQIVSDLVRKMNSITYHLGSAAEFGAMTAHKLSGIAKFKADEIDDANPLGEKSIETLRGIAALTKTANEAGMIGLTLIRASKDNPDAFSPSETDSRPSPARVREILDMARSTHDRA